MFAIIVIPIEILMIISTIGILKINNTRSESNQALENVIDTLEKIIFNMAMEPSGMQIVSHYYPTMT